MSINIVESIATANKCYQACAPLTPRGIMLHSVGIPQPERRGVSLRPCRVGGAVRGG